MSTDSRTFHLGDILSVTTGCLVSPRHMGGVYDLLNYMTGDNLFTHQLPRANQECEGPLLAQHPDLADVEVPATFGGKDHVEAWLAEQVVRFGEYRDVRPLPAADHTRINPITELRMIRSDIEIITLEVPGE